MTAIRNRRGSLLLGGLLLLVVLGLGLAGMQGAAVMVLTAGAFFFALRALGSRASEIVLLVLCANVLAVAVTRPAPKLWPEEFSAESSARLVAQWQRDRVFDTRLPAVVHIILDEMVSPGVLEGVVPEAEAVRALGYALSEHYGFRVFDSVYSRAYYSHESLVNMMAGEYGGAFGVAGRYTAGARPDNLYFRDFQDRGYHTVVFDTAVLDFCAHEAVDMCVKFDSFDPRGERGDLAMRAVDLVDGILRSYEPSMTAGVGRTLLRRVHGGDHRERDALGTANRYDVQGFPGWFDQFGGFLRSVPRGTHVFAHFMVPHSPYLLNERCELIEGAYDSGYNLAERYASEEQRREVRRRYYASYLRQAECILRRTGALFERLSREDWWNDALVVVHGDHGSRISSGSSYESMVERDYLDNFGTFFAVRGPDIEPGVDCRQMSLPQMFRYFMKRGDVPQPDDPAPVVVTSAGSTLREEPMPLFGCAASRPES